MKNIFLLIAVLCAIHLGCNSNAGVDPHLTQEEILEQQLRQINTVVGKWKIRRNTKDFLQTNACELVSVEFTEEGKFILKLGFDEEGTFEQVYFSGRYDLVFDEEATTEVRIDRILLMNDDYQETNNPPETGQVATLTDLVIENETGIRFSLQLGPSTDADCATEQPLSVAANKEAEIAPDAPEGSNGQLLLQEWRLIDVQAFIRDTEEDVNVYCQFLADQYEFYCRNEESGPIAADCSQPHTITFTFTGYGTYLITVFDQNLDVLEYIEGQWRWHPDPIWPAYERFQVIDSASEWNSVAEEDIQDLVIIALTEGELQIDESFEDVNIRYFFQGSDMTIPANTCGDLNTFLE